MIAFFLPITRNFQLRAERTKETPMHKKKIDFTKWNKFTGKGRKVLLPPPAEDVEVSR